MDRPLRVFLSYAHADEMDGGWKSHLVEMLRSLEYDGIIEHFDDGMFEVGASWDETIREKLLAADLVVLLVSPAFIASDYVTKTEVTLACDRRDRGEAKILPVILRDCDWTYKRWAAVDAAPKAASVVKPLEEWDRPNTALKQISTRLRELKESWRPADRVEPKRAVVTPPYCAFRSHTAEQADDFFGRERLADFLWKMLGEHRVVLLNGPSGSGKSSLINAGIEPRLLQDGKWQVLRMRPREKPLVELATALVPIFEPETRKLDLRERGMELAPRFEREPARILTHARELQAEQGKGLFVIIDQLEETYNLARPANPEQHAKLIEMIAGVAQAPPDVPIRVLLAIRADFQWRLLEDDPELVHALQPATLLLPPMRSSELARAIIGPAMRRGVTIAPELLGMILADLQRNRDALPLLEVALEELWRLRDNATIGVESLDQIGGISGALAARADKSLEELDLLEDDRVRRLFMELVKLEESGSTASATRFPRARSELSAELWDIVEKLAPTRLLVIDSANMRDPTVDITHESLFRSWDRLARWIEQERDFLLFRQKLELRRLEWEEHDRHWEYSWPRSDLGRARAWQTSHALNEAQAEFLALSEAEHAATAAAAEATRFWLGLELHWDRRLGPPIHELSTLRELQRAPIAIRSAVLLSALRGEDRARKLIREPAVTFRVLAGIDRTAAREVARSSLAVIDETSPSPTIGEALLAFGRWAAPIEPTVIPATIARAEKLAEGADRPDQLQFHAETLHTLSNVVDGDEIRRAGSTVIRRITALVETTHTPDQLRATAEVVRHLSAVADRDAVRRSASTTVGQAMALMENSTDPFTLQTCARVVERLAEMVEIDAANAAVRQAMERAQSTASPAVLQASAQTVQALVGRIDRETADATIQQAIEQAHRTTSPSALQASAQVMRALAGGSAREAVGFTIRRAVEQAEKTADPYTLRASAKVIGALAVKADIGVVRQATTTTIERALELTVLTTSPSVLQVVAEIIMAVVDSGDREMVRQAASTAVRRALDGAAKATSPSALQAYAHVIETLAGRVDADTADGAIRHALVAIADTTEPDHHQACARAIRALAGQVGPEAADIAIRQILNSVEATNAANILEEYAKAVRPLAAEADAATAERVAHVTIRRAIELAESMSSPADLLACARVIRALAGQASRAVAVHACVALAKHPLGGDDEVTSELIAAIALAVDAPGLVEGARVFAFRRCIDHLAEHHSWLDLAALPTSIDATLAEHDRLVAQAQ